MEKENTAFTSKLPDEISITKYENLTYTRTQNGNEVKAMKGIAYKKRAC